MASRKDDIYATPMADVGDFRFDETVAAVFDDMIERSVPGYRLIVDMCGQLAARYAQDGTTCYDLGCSLGAATVSMLGRLTSVNCRIVAVDNSAAMLASCAANIAKVHATIPVDLLEADVTSTRIEDASVVILNFVLQFIQPERRDQLLARIYRGTVDGGALVLSEKLTRDDPLLADLHDDFKRAHGYSELEIAQKRAALENVLVADDLPTHLARLRAAGYREVCTWYRCLDFVSIVAVK